MPSNEYYDHGTFPTTGSPGSSASMGSEFDLITAGLDKLPVLAGNGGKAVKVNAAGSALESSKVTITEPATAATLTLADGATLATAGAYAVTLTATAATGLTLPTTGTLSTLAGAESLSNKTLVAPALGTPASGVLTNCTFPTLNQNTSGNAATVTTNANLTGHITSTGNAAVLGSFTHAQLNTAVSDANLAASGNNTDITSIAPTGLIDISSGTAGQIKFPSTQNISADVNTLDDYEEGTWTPAIGAGIAAPTYAAQSGTYTKIGNLVFYTCGISVNGGTLDAGHLQITGFPFIAANANSGTNINRASGGIVQASRTSSLPTLSLQGSTMYFYDSDGSTYIGTEMSSSTVAVYFSGVMHI